MAGADFPASAGYGVSMYPRSGWYHDPTKRHELRYWDGFRWTEHVATSGVQAVDPMNRQNAVRPESQVRTKTGQVNSVPVVQGASSRIDPLTRIPFVGIPNLLIEQVLTSRKSPRVFAISTEDGRKVATVSEPRTWHRARSKKDKGKAAAARVGNRLHISALDGTLLMALSRPNTDSRWTAGVFVDSFDGTSIGAVVRESAGAFRAMGELLGEALPYAFVPVGLPGSSVAGKIVKSKARLGRLSGRVAGAMVEATGTGALSKIAARPSVGYGRFRLDCQGKTAGWLTGTTSANDELDICDETGRPVGSVALTKETRTLFKREEASCAVTVHDAVDASVHALTISVAIALLVDSVVND